MARKSKVVSEELISSEEMADDVSPVKAGVYIAIPMHDIMICYNARNTTLKQGVVIRDQALVKLLIQCGAAVDIQEV